jgi:hypothetical protein
MLSRQLLRQVTLLVVLAAALCPGRDARAQGNLLISVDENGAGTIQFPGGPVNPLVGFPGFDPGPGGLPNALTYPLAGAPNAIVGDLLLQEVAGGPVSEVIRFNQAGPFGGTNLAFYSDLPESGEPQTLADTGFPAALYPLQLNLPEVQIPQGFGAIYTPTPNQPGFMPGVVVTYTIISDPVPAPASASLLALAGLVAARRRR